MGFLRRVLFAAAVAAGFIDEDGVTSFIDEDGVTSFIDEDGVVG